MATSVSDDLQHDDIQREQQTRARATVRWPSFTRAETAWSIVGLALLAVFLTVALLRR